MATSNILPFSPNDTGTNLLSDAAYLAASDRSNGNQPGVASSKLNNKALRQSSAIAAGVAQYIANRQATNVTDALTSTQIETALAAATKGRLIRTLSYLRVGGVQMVVIDGAAATATGAGTYTPGLGMSFCIAKVQAGGGAGGGPSLPTAGNVTLGSPGGSGAYGVSVFTAATIGASQPVTVGLGGVKVVAGTGGTGGTSSLGSLLTSAGGIGGGILASQTPPAVAGNSSSVGPTGANWYRSNGTGSAPTFSATAAANGGFGGNGGASVFGGGGAGPAGNGPGIDAPNYGSGGSGAVINNGFGGNTAGGNGGDGIVIIEEYAA